MNDFRIKVADFVNYLKRAERFLLKIFYKLSFFKKDTQQESELVLATELMPKVLEPEPLPKRSPTITPSSESERSLYSQKFYLLKKFFPECIVG